MKSVMSHSKFTRCRLQRRLYSAAVCSGSAWHIKLSDALSVKQVCKPLVRSIYVATKGAQRFVPLEIRRPAPRLLSSRQSDTRWNIIAT